MKVSDVMVRAVICVRDSAPLGEAARLMWENDLGFVPVLSANGGLAGVVTDRDAFLAAYFQGRPLWEIPVKSAMSSRVWTCPPDAEVDHVERLMREFQVHRMPVVTGAGNLVGVISLNDIARRAQRDGDLAQEEKVAITLSAIAEPRSPESAPAPM